MADPVADPVEAVAEAAVAVAVGGVRRDTVEWIREENIPASPDQEIIDGG